MHFLFFRLHFIFETISVLRTRSKKKSKTQDTFYLLVHVWLFTKKAKGKRKLFQKISMV